MTESSPTALVGQRVRGLRERGNLSLRALSGRCGLSINTISQIERGDNSPTVSSLHRLAEALGVSITELFRDEHEHAVVFVPAADRLMTERGGVRLESLGVGLPYQQLQPFLMTIAPGSGINDEPVAHEGEEFVHCLAGEIEYRIGPESYHLKAGDSLLFASAQPHQFHNRTAGPAVCLLIFLGRNERASVSRLHLNGESEA